MSEMTEATRDRLVADVKTVLADAEELFRLSADDASGKFAEARTRLGEKLAAARARVDDIEEALLARTKQVAKATDTYVRENPWQSVGVAAGIGFLVGLLVSRR